MQKKNMAIISSLQDDNLILQQVRNERIFMHEIKNAVLVFEWWKIMQIQVYNSSNFDELSNLFSIKLYELQEDCCTGECKRCVFCCGPTCWLVSEFDILCFFINISCSYWWVFSYWYFLIFIFFIFIFFKLVFFPFHIQIGIIFMVSSLQLATD